MQSNKKEKINISKIKKMITIIIIIFFTYIMNERIFILTSNKLNFEITVPSIPGQIYNFIIYSLIFLFFYFIKNNPFKPSLYLTIFYYVISIVNFIKGYHSLSPIYLSDLNFLNNGASDIISLISFKEILIITIYTTKIAIINIIFLIFIYFIHKNINLGINKNKRKLGIIFIIISLTITLLPIIPKKFVIPEISKNDTISNQYVHLGFFAGIYITELKSEIKEPEDYNKEQTEDILENYKSNKEINTWGTPNVIVILSESFFDISKIKDIKFNKDIYEDYNYVKENSKATFIPISPMYGGRTTNIEFEFNTLSSFKYLSDTYIPYNTFYDNENMQNYPSIAKIFNDNNYDTSIISCMDNGSIYKLMYTYPKLHYQEILLLDGLLKKYNLKELEGSNIQKGKYVSDEIIFEEIKDSLETKEKPLFLFTKTIQNHMPYGNKYKTDELEISSSSNLYTENELNIINDFAQGIYDNGKALRAFYDYIQTIEEPTIVIFFGDHLPGLTTNNGTDLIEKSGIFNNNSLEGLLNKYATEGLIFSNYDIDTSDLSNYISFDNLSTYMLKHLDINLGTYKNYIDYIYDASFEYIAGNRYISIDSNNKIYKTNEIPNNLKEIYQIRQNLQYYLINEYYKN